MKKTLWKRVGAAVLAAAMMLSIAACGGGTAVGNLLDGKSDAEIEKLLAPASNGKVFEDGTPISITVSNHASWPHRDDWKLWQYMSEATGAKLELTAIPVDDYFTKVNLMMAARDTLPDLLHVTQKKMVDQNANQGALVPFDDNMRLLPDYQKYMETIPENDREELLLMRRCADGKIYNAPSYGTQTVTNTRGWLYRKDIFEKHGLAVPTTYDELYTVAKKLKELYPDSYPICFRMGFTGLRNMGAQWKPYQSFDVYYDFVEGHWSYGSFEQTTKEMVEWLHKMVAEGICPPNIVDITTKNWEEYMVTDRGFITLDYMVRIDHFNNLMAGKDTGYELAFMAPPAAKNGPDGKPLNKMTKCSVDLSGYSVCNTGKNDRMINAFKLINWMYTEEAEELLSWGKENETFYVNENGNRRFIIPEGTDDTPRNLYGVGSFGLYQRMNEGAFEASYSEKQVEACKTASAYLEEYINPMWWLSFSDEEDARKADIDMALGSYSEEWIAKFISGKEPISKWDEFVANGQQYNVDEYLNIYTTAYDRVLNAGK